MSHRAVILDPIGRHIRPRVFAALRVISIRLFSRGRECLPSPMDSPGCIIRRDATRNKWPPPFDIATPSDYETRANGLSSVCRFPIASGCFLLLSACFYASGRLSIKKGCLQLIGRTQIARDAARKLAGSLRRAFSGEKGLKADTGSIFGK